MKDKNIKININRPELSKEEIKNMQDFNDVLTQYKLMPKPFYKSNWILAVGVITIVLIVVCMFVFRQREEPLQALKINRNFIHPAMANIDIPYTHFEVESGSSDTLKMPSGTRIIIPAYPFVNAQGKSISGKVKIAYREFRDPVDFMLSGIPMEYDSAGSKYQFESAGMCEIVGSQNNTPVFVNVLCPVKIEMKPVKTDPKFNMYYLDTVEKNWKNIGKPEVIADQQKSDDLLNKEPDLFAIDSVYSDNNRKCKQLSNEIAQLKKHKPVQPKMANPSIARFKLSFEPELFPELKSYSDIVFEVQKKDEPRSKELLAITWDHLTLKNMEEDKTYKVDMELYENKNKRVKARKEGLLVQPVFEGKNYDEALEVFKVKDKEYAEALLAKEAKEKKIKEELAKKTELMNQASVAKEKFEKAALLENTMINNDVVRISFMVSKFGIYNSDCAFKQMASKINLSFADNNGEAKHIDVLYQLILNKNAMMVNNFNKCCNNKFNFNRNDRLILFTIYPDSRIGYYLEDDCKTLPSTGDYSLKLKSSTEHFNNVDDVKKFLGIVIK